VFSFCFTGIPIECNSSLLPRKAKRRSEPNAALFLSWLLFSGLSLSSNPFLPGHLPAGGIGPSLQGELCDFVECDHCPLSKTSEAHTNRNMTCRLVSVLTVECRYWPHKCASSLPAVHSLLVPSTFLGLQCNLIGLSLQEPKRHAPKRTTLNMFPFCDFSGCEEDV
jgi:hypothetical protein